MCVSLDFGYYFPRYKTLSSTRKEEFERLCTHIIDNPNMQIQLIGPKSLDNALSVPIDAAGLVAGHIAELFLGRTDILDRVLGHPLAFLFYTTRQAYLDAGGAMGGQFDPIRGAVMMEHKRLVEGFGAERPGVSPFLHEFGHMLDFVDIVLGGYRMTSDGMLPGLRKNDGAIFTPEARMLFIEGKQLERERYLALANSAARKPVSAYPIGHPYVFQNDGEFCAGYLELWLRNPNYFATQNPRLFDGYATLFKWDPRTAWPKDFDFYVLQNRAFFDSGEPLWPCGITVGEP